jgi:cytochrome c553
LGSRGLLALAIGLLAGICAPMDAVAADVAGPSGVTAEPPQMAASAAADSPQTQAMIALGRRLYREGVGATGAPLEAVGAAQSRLTGKDAACVTCHRRSGYGTSEGRFVIRPIIAPALLQELNVPIQIPRIKARVGVRQRPPYDAASLARAIRDGVDAGGKTLDRVMPRYALRDDEMQALSAYLFTLSAEHSPGVDTEEIHFATVIQPGVAPERRRAMLDIMQAFVDDKASNSRSEEQRRSAGNMRMYRAYRKWVLHVWDLTGPSDNWGAQLEARYRQQPVFALVGGLGDASWAPIHTFSERFEIPSVFPLVNVPVVAADNHYTFYLSKGVVLEADVLAAFLRGQGPKGKLVQVHRAGDAAGLAAAQALTAARRAAGEDVPVDVVLEGSADAAFWDRVMASGPASVALWLSSADLKSLPDPLRAGKLPVYLSWALLGHRPTDLAALSGTDVRMIYLSDLAPRHEPRLLRNKVWLRNKGIGLSDEALQVNTQFTMTIVSDVLGHMYDNFSRDYFVERVEHVVGQTPVASHFQTVSLGPGQRFAAKGGSIVQLVDGDVRQMKPLSAWLVP